MTNRADARLSRRGFTLLEVLVALSIMALAGVAIVRLGTASAVSAAQLQGRAIAGIVAENALVDLMLSSVPPTVGRRESVTENGGQRWRVTQTVERSPDQRVLRVAIAVRPTEPGRPGQSDLHTFMALPQVQP